MSNKRNPLFTQYGIVSNNSMSFNNVNPVNRTLTGMCQLEIADSNNVISSDALTISKVGQTGYFTASGISQSFVFQPTNTNGTGANVLSISENVAAVNKTLVIRDDDNQTSFTQEGPIFSINGPITFGSQTVMTSILATNITGINLTANFIGTTGIVARNITGTNVTANFIDATGIVARNITCTNVTSNFIGATGIVATNITGTNITANFIGASSIVTDTFF